MKALLLISILPALLIAAGGDTLKYSSAVRTLTNGQKFYADIHWKSMIDTNRRIINGALGNINLSSTANIDPVKLDTTKTLLMRGGRVDTVLIRDRLTCDTAVISKIRTTRLTGDSIYATKIKTSSFDTLTGRRANVTTGIFDSAFITGAKITRSVHDSVFSRIGKFDSVTVNKRFKTDSVYSRVAKFDSAKIGKIDSIYARIIKFDTLLAKKLKVDTMFLSNINVSIYTGTVACTLWQENSGYVIATLENVPYEIQRNTITLKFEGTKSFNYTVPGNEISYRLKITKIPYIDAYISANGSGRSWGKYIIIGLAGTVSPAKNRSYSAFQYNDTPLGTFTTGETIYLMDDYSFHF